MPVAGFGFCGPTYQTRDGLWNRERCFNWYAAIDESKHAQSQIALLPTPGIAAFANVITPPIRGLWAGDERLFAVGGGDLVEISSTGVVTKEGDVQHVATPVQFAANGVSLLIVSGDYAYLADGTTVTRVADAISCVYLDGYYIILWPDSNTIQISTDGVTWDPLDTQNKMGSLDRLVMLQAHEGHLWLFGKKTIDIWYNSGAADFPFERISGSFIDQGTMAPWSVANIDKKLYWLGSDERGQGRVFRAEGYTPVRISTSAIEYLISTYGALGVDPQITGCGYEEDGHTFYVLTFPRAQATLVYDLTTNMWHERAHWSGTAWTQWRGAGFHVYVFGKHLVASIAARIDSGALDTAIYQQSLTIPTASGAAIRRNRAAPYITNSQQSLAHHYVRFLTSCTSNGVLRYLKDDGITWSTLKTAIPNAKHEFEFRRLGQARNRVYELTVTESVTSGAIIEAYLHASPTIQR
jgi:hypothetical protein